VLADTHDFLDPRVREFFSGVDHILHAGDIGAPWLIHQLEEVAPVTAVVGNCDTGLGFKETEVVELGGRKILLQHQVDPRVPSDGLRRRLLKEKPHLVVFGHTHRQFCCTANGVMFLNPGYAGKPRFHHPRSVAVLQIKGGAVTTAFQPLPE
jgi:putative phosphoesterase